MIRDQFLESGIKCEHHDASSSDEERDAAIKRLETCEIQVLTNVGIMTEGVDIPKVSCIIMARPTKSYNLHIQCLGRGTRTADGKFDCKILDHAGNTLEHGMMTPEPEPSLHGYEVATKIKIFTCAICYGVQGTPINHASPCGACLQYFCKHCKNGFNSPFQECPECKWSAIASTGRLVENEEGELVEIKPAHQNLDIYRAEQHCEAKLREGILKNKNPWVAFFDTKENYGEPIAKIVFFRLCRRFNLRPHESSSRGSARPRTTPIREGVETELRTSLSDWPFK
jgi:hypothetical protein